MSETALLRAEILKALAQPTRLKIVEFLRDGEQCVCKIFPAIGEEQSNTSRHLSTLQAAGILSRRKDGLKIYYAIKHPQVLQLVELARQLMVREITGRHELLRAV